jgi:hypothetical protein
MKRPAIKTKRYLDWIEVRSYLAKKYPGLKMDLGKLFDDIHNGCFKSVERPDPEEPDMFDPEMTKFAEALFEEFPDAVGHYDDIEIYIWW